MKLNKKQIALAIEAATLTLRPGVMRYAAAAVEKSVASGLVKEAVASVVAQTPALAGDKIASIVAALLAETGMDDSRISRELIALGLRRRAERKADADVEEGLEAVIAAARELQVELEKLGKAKSLPAILRAAAFKAEAAAKNA